MPAALGAPAGFAFCAEAFAGAAGAETPLDASRAPGQADSHPGDWAGERRSVSRADLIGIMRPRVEEILDEVRGVLEAAGFDQMPSRQVVLTGGASQIPGLDTLAARILGQNVRIGRPLRIQGLAQQHTAPCHAATVGLALHAANPQDEWWDFEMPDRGGALGLKRAIRWFRTHW